MSAESRRPVRAVLTALVTAALALGALVGAPTAAHAGTVGGVKGYIESAVQQRDGSVKVVGWMYRLSNPNRHMLMCVWSDGACRKRVYTNVYRHSINETYHLTSTHGFVVTLPKSVVGDYVSIRDYPDNAPIVDVTTPSTPGSRIVAWARKYVGSSPYRYGGETPAGFDCSGYTKYVYAHAQVAPSLPHSSDGQRFAPYMHVIPRTSARPGDLVFYLSGGSAYHVAIYAGNGKQYAATVPGEKIRYQSIWSSAVEFRTDWH